MAPLAGDRGYNKNSGVYTTKIDAPTTTADANFLPDYVLFDDSRPTTHTKPAFIDAVTGDAVSYAELRSLTAAAGVALAVAGLAPGLTALLVAPNSVDFPVVALGVLTAGAVLSTANPLLTRTELAAQIEDCRPFLIITTDEIAPKLEDLVPQPLIIIDKFIQSLKGAAFKRFPAKKPATSGTFVALPKVAALNRFPSTLDAATVLYSSGTTGKSKGVVTTHRNYIAMSEGLRRVWGSEDDVYCCVLPMTHMFGFSMFVCMTLSTGATTVVLRRYTLDALFRSVSEHRVTRLPVVPPMVIHMTRSVVGRGFDLSSLEEVVCSGAPIGREHVERFARCYPDVRLSQCYGMTETSGPVIISYGVKSRYQVAMGRLIPGIEAKIVDVRTGKALPPNRHGELWLRGHAVMHGYLGNQEATMLAINQDGWLQTGDLCYMDTRGFVHIVDRIKELIKYKAYQVAPAELEEILAAHPDVFDVAVLPYPHEEAGEIPMACIVAKAGCKLKETDIFAYMKDKVAPYKSIRKVIFLESIPRSPSGKILRAHLKSSVYEHERIEISARL